MSTKLNQILAVEKDAKNKTKRMITDVYHKLQQTDLMEGFNKTYQQNNEEDQGLSPIRKPVRVKTQDLLNETREVLTDLINITATKDFANTKARANVVVGDIVLAENVPATHLLFLEKRCKDLRELVNTIPVLDSGEEWKLDENDKLYKSVPTTTERTKKVQKPIVLYDATDKHPAQTQLITEDIPVGIWTTQKYSGAIPAIHKKALLERVDQLSRAVKGAREKANAVEVDQQDFGATLVDFIFGE